MKIYTKIIIGLIILSFVWVYIIIDLAYYTIFNEKTLLVNSLSYSAQFKLVNVLGILLFITFAILLFFSRSKNNFN